MEEEEGGGGGGRRRLGFLRRGGERATLAVRPVRERATSGASGADASERGRFA